MRPRCAHTNGVTEISASATRLPSRTMYVADTASCRQPTRSVPHHRRHGIVQTADSRQRRVTPRNPIRTTRSAEGAWGVGLHHRYALRRCATIPEAEWSDIAARRVSSGFGTDAAVGQRNNCRKIVLVSIKVATFTPNIQYLRSVNAHLCMLKFTGLPIEAHAGVHGIRMCGQKVVSKHNCSRGNNKIGR